MELGNHQSYLLRPVHKEDLIELVVVSNPKIPHEERKKAFNITNELIIDVKVSTDELMKGIMTSAVKKFPVKFYLPCPQCEVLATCYSGESYADRLMQCFALQLINILICQNITSYLCPVSNHVPKLCNQLSTNNIYAYICCCRRICTCC